MLALRGYPVTTIQVGEHALNSIQVLIRGLAEAERLLHKSKRKGILVY